MLRVVKNTLEVKPYIKNATKAGTSGEKAGIRNHLLSFGIKLLLTGRKIFLGWQETSENEKILKGCYQKYVFFQLITIFRILIFFILGVSFEKNYFFIRKALTSGFPVLLYLIIP